MLIKWNSVTPNIPKCAIASNEIFIIVNKQMSQTKLLFGATINVTYTKHLISLGINLKESKLFEFKIV